MIHIGNIIKDKLEHKKISITQFAEDINCTRRNVYKIFNKSNIDTELLLRVNEAIGENLFLNYLTDKEIVKHAKGRVNTAELNRALSELRAAVIVRGEEKRKEELLKKKRKELKQKKKR